MGKSSDEEAKQVIKQTGKLPVSFSKPKFSSGTNGVDGLSAEKFIYNTNTLTVGLPDGNIFNPVAV